MSVIRCQQLTRRFGDFTAVDELSLDVRPGEVFGLLGGNGGGKSTAVRMLTGILPPTSGRIKVAGVDVVAEPQRVRERIGYVAQRVSLYPNLRVAENIEFYGRIHGLRPRDVAARAKSLGARLGIGAEERALARELPAGARQRLAVLLALLHRPQVLFLDEPTAGMDLANRRELFDLIRELAREGMAVFMTSHHLDEMEGCDRLAFIHRGRLVGVGAPDELKKAVLGGERHSVSPAAGVDPGALAASLEQQGFNVQAQRDKIFVTLRGAIERRMLEAALPDAGGEKLALAPAPLEAVFERVLASGHELPPIAEPPPPPRPSLQMAARPPQRRGGALASLARLAMLVHRERIELLRDRLALALFLVLPLFTLVLFSFSAASDVKDLPLGVLDAARSPRSRGLQQAIDATGYFERRAVGSLGAAHAALRSGELAAVLVIPADVERRFAEGQVAESELLVDGADPVLATNAASILGATFAAHSATLAPPAAGGDGDEVGQLRVAARAVGNPRLDSEHYMTPALLGYLSTFLTVLLAALAIVREREIGTYEQLRVTPVAPWEIAMSKATVLALAMIVDVALVVLLAGGLYGVWPRGSLPLLFACSGIYILFALSVGLIISAGAARSVEATQKSLVLALPLLNLSGFVYPVAFMPAAFQKIAEVLPTLHYLRLARGIYLSGSGFADVAPDLAVVAGWVALLGFVVVRKLGRKEAVS